VVALATLVLVSHPAVARAQSVAACIPAGVARALALCPERRAAPTTDREPAAPRRRAAPPRRVDAPDVSTPTPEVTIDATRPELRAPAEARSRALLLREIAVLERLVARTREEDPRGADALFRLAETRLELHRMDERAIRALDEPIAEARRADTAPRLRELIARQASAERAAEAVLEAAIADLGRLAARYPQHPRMDEALFTLAHCLSALARQDLALEAYYRLIREHPESRFVPQAYLAFAEHYFRLGELENARQFYERVLTIAPERNPVYGYALYKLAWVLHNQERFGERCAWRAPPRQRTAPCLPRALGDSPSARSTRSRWDERGRVAHPGTRPASRRALRAARSAGPRPSST
jgi:tetratricopeptide (TPR) repeat protein